MIKTYSELDLKSPGCYGFCPIYNSCDTCYSKDLHLVNSASASLSDDPAFMDKFDSASGCFAIPSNVDIPNSSLGFNTNQSASHVPLSCHRPASERIPLLVVTLVTKIQLYKVIIWLARIRYHHHPISILL